MVENEAVKMGQNVCPNCGCIIGGGVGYEQDDTVFCCEACATGEGLCHCKDDETAEK